MEDSYRKALAHLPLGPWRFFDRLPSTNDEALAWAAAGAADMSLVVAEEQTRGRGRGDRAWFTPRASALAFSLVLVPRPVERERPTLLTGLLALSLAQALETLGLEVEIKWPNDVLVAGKKLAGTLLESSWNGGALQAIVLGMGVNVTPASLPPPARVDFPATCVEGELGAQVGRPELLAVSLSNLLAWRPRLGTQAFLQAWEGRLAYRSRQVIITPSQGESFSGRIAGLDAGGGLHLVDARGNLMTVHHGDVHLRAVP